MNTRIEKAREAGEVMKLYSSLVGSEGCTWNEYYPSVEDVDIDIENGYLYIMRDERGEVITAGAMGEYGDLDDLGCWLAEVKKPCELCRLGVDLAHQNHGLAREMLEFLETDALRKGYDAVRLLVSEKNKNAVKLYDSMNYARVGETRKYDQDWICREKRL